MKRSISWHVIFSVTLVLTTRIASSAQISTPYEQDCAKIASVRGRDADRLHQLFKIQWDYNLRESPELATEVGAPGADDRWSDDSLEAIARRQRELQAPLKALAAIHRAALNASDQLNYDLFKRGSEEAVEGTRFKSEYLAINQMNGVQQAVPEILEIAPHNNVPAYENIIARLNALPALVDQNIVLLQKGLAAGITPPRITLREVPDQIKSQTVDDLEKNAVAKAFTAFAPQIAESDRARLRQEAARALHEKVVPAFTKLYDS
jgi:uncharacterized protein (DUF885 family)